MLTIKKLEKFIQIRNNSSLISNIQFMADADECGFDARELGMAKKRDDGGYEWDVTYGKLVEYPNHKMELIFSI